MSRWIETTMDLGELDQRLVNVEYDTKNDFVDILTVELDGIDITRFVMQDAIDCLADVARADVAEMAECAAEAYWEEQREQRMHRGAA